MKNNNSETELNKMQGSREEESTGRRTFFKKVLYSAPTLVALGTLAKPKNADAATPPTPPSAPEWQ